ncbi:AIPR family protein [Aeromicrobium sp. Root472D3]|uniref:AIPR family protein n=1 Tax=Aeromicrobium sp. Root472D3 TaxID=1736540 RepID=UPI0006F5F725|nr:AIPR family protein [Aeromicrobium sp. Root472D3]KQX72669.1 hypothetical protein ASD10_15405 [Aeromicrobium sp. Root472D3]
MDPLIRGLFKQFREGQGLEQMREDDAFELFAASLLLRDDLLDQVELSDLLMDKSTPGVDVVLLEVNGQIVSGANEAKDLCADRASIEVSLHVLQAKTSTSIDSAQILNMGDVVKRLCSGSSPFDYPKLQGVSEALGTIFEDYAGKLKERPSVHLRFVTSANDVAVMDDNVQARAQTVERELSGLAFLGDVSVVVCGATRLYDASRTKSNANEADIVLEKSVNLPKMPDIDQAILGVVSIDQLLKLVQNDDGSLDERVFYDNVRGFKGEDNDVNAQIFKTLESSDRALLPVLNNGVTVVATSYSPKPGDAVTLTGYQIVNGCQTSHCIHLAESAIGEARSEVFVPIRLVVTENKDVASRIIRATNSQTAVNDSDLVALTEFQKKLEEYYQQDQLRSGLTYERRSGQFYSKDVTRTRVVTISEQMRALAATFLDLPHLAARYPQHLYDEVGRTIFEAGHRFAPYVASAYAAYRLESAFRTNLESEYKPLRYHILMAYRYQLFGGRSAPLNSGKIDTESQALVDSLRTNDYVSKFRTTAETVLATAQGQTPSADRLKRSPFTTELVGDLVRK